MLQLSADPSCKILQSSSQTWGKEGRLCSKKSVPSVWQTHRLQSFKMQSRPNHKSSLKQMYDPKKNRSPGWKRKHALKQAVCTASLASLEFASLCLTAQLRGPKKNIIEKLEKGAFTSRELVHLQKGRKHEKNEGLTSDDYECKAK